MIAKDQDIFERNLQFFADFFPVLHGRLLEHAPLAELIYDSEGDPDVQFKGVAFYGQGAGKHARKQLARFQGRDNRIALSAIHSGTVDKDAGETLVNVLRRATSQGITFNQLHTTDVSFHTICLGFGLGQYIEEFLERNRCRNLIIIEPNIEFLYQSLHVFDWQKFGKDCLSRDRKLHLLTHTNPEALLRDFRLIYRQYGAAFIDGLTIYEHYQNPSFEPLKAFLRNHGDLLFSGLGFFEDELNMIGNTYGVLSSGEEYVFRWSDKDPGLPVFVVGTGPSLDTALDVIRENQHKAIIVSCGTSLGVMLRNGIKPDFHMELERGQAQIDLPRKLVKRSKVSLDDIWLVGSTTLLPGIKDVFKKRVFFFRQQLSSYPVFSGKPYQCIRYPSPSVTNVGLSFAQDVGFREFYFFGLDLGFKDARHHHASSASYGSYHHDHDRTLKGNFGGEMLSNHFYSWIRDGFETAIANISSGFRYYNCSDGGLIKGAIPKLPECVNIAEPKRPKADVVAEIASAFTPYTKEIFDSYWQSGGLIREAKVLTQRLVEAVEENQDLYDKKYVQKISAILDLMNHGNGAKMVLRGTVFQCLLAVEYYLDRIEQADRRDQFAGIVREELISSFNRLNKILAEELTILSETGRLGARFDPGLI